MGLFNKKPKQEAQELPEIEEESSEEEYPVEEVEEIDDEKPIKKPIKKEEKKEEQKYMEVPVVLTDDKVRVMVWENNIMLKELLEMAKKE